MQADEEVTVPAKALAPTQRLEQVQDVREVYRFNPEEFLGEGSYGQVIVGELLNTRERHALKFIDPKDNPEWEREVSLLRQCAHPCVQEMLGLYRTKSRFVIVTPVAVCDLREFLFRHGRLAESVAAKFASEMCRGLAHVHSHQVIHRDFKPSNVLLRLGDSCTLSAAIADFGISRTETGGGMTANVQTLWYRAPELLFATMDVLAPSQDQQDRVAIYNSAVDTWSFGLVVFEMLVGKRFMSGATAAECLRQIYCQLGSWPEDVPWNCRKAGQLESWPEASLGPGAVSDKEWPRAASWNVVRCAVCWSPKARHSCGELSNAEWFSLKVAVEVPQKPGQRRPWRSLSLVDPVPRRQASVASAAEAPSHQGEQDHVIVHHCHVVATSLPRHCHVIAT